MSGRPRCWDDNRAAWSRRSFRPERATARLSDSDTVLSASPIVMWSKSPLPTRHDVATGGRLGSSNENRTTAERPRRGLRGGSMRDPCRVVLEFGQEGPFGQMRCRGAFVTWDTRWKRIRSRWRPDCWSRHRAPTFDAEAAALTGKAYRLLAEALNSYEDTAGLNGAVRKRERRLLRDRRSIPGPSDVRGPHRTTEPAPVGGRHADRIPQPSYGRVDLRI